MFEPIFLQFLFKGFLAFGGLLALFIAALLVDKYSPFHVFDDYDESKAETRLIFIAVLIASACYVIGQAL